jgi:hypothetical protein
MINTDLSYNIVNTNINKRDFSSTPNFLQSIAYKLTVLIEEILVLVEDQSIPYKQELQNLSRELNKATVYCLKSAAPLNEIVSTCAQSSELMACLNRKKRKNHEHNFCNQLKTLVRQLHLYIKENSFLDVVSDKTTDDDTCSELSDLSNESIESGQLFDLVDFQKLKKKNDEMHAKNPFRRIS